MRPAGLEGIATFCLGQRDVVIVPVEAWTVAPPERARLTVEGRALLDRGGLDAAFADRFEQAHARCQERSARLAERAPRTWSAPRLSNVMVVRRGASVRPFMLPLPRASQVVHETDFDEARGSLELAAYAMSHAERMGVVGDVARAHLAQVGWWLVADDADVADFTRGAKATPRADGALFRIVAEALPWLRTLWEPALRPPPDDPRAFAHVPDTEILVPDALEPAVRALASALSEAALDVARTIRAEQRAASPRATSKKERPLEQLCDWLRQVRPRLLVTSARGDALWAPDTSGHLGPIRTALEKSPHDAIASLHEDLRTVDARTTTFVTRVVDRAALPRSSDAVDPDGGVWIDPKRQLIAYALVQPGLVPTEEPAPPLHRWLLGARVAHEWAHLVEGAGWVAIPEERSAEHERAMTALAAVFDAIAGGDPRVRAMAEAEAKLLGGSVDESTGAVFARKTMERVGDYRANLVAREVLPPEELEAYARVNARTHAGSGLGPFAQLMRHAIEVQYLALAGGADPYDYLFRSTFFGIHFDATGICSRSQAATLFDATSRVLDCWAVDRARFRAPS